MVTVSDSPEALNLAGTIFNLILPARTVLTLDDASSLGLRLPAPRRTA
jgi:hypothetical protein